MLYDDKYSSEYYFWGKKPSSLCYRLLKSLPPDGSQTALDIGCGEGRNAIFLARNGYQTSAFDVSETGIKKAREWAKELNLSVNFFQADLKRYRLQEPLDILFSSGSLQYIPTVLREEFIEHYKDNTKAGGLNAHTIPVFKPFLPPDPQRDEDEEPWRSGEILYYFHDWIIEYFEEEIIEYSREGFPSKFAVNRIIARNPGSQAMTLME